MISPPRPHIIDDRVVGIVKQADGGPTGVLAAPPMRKKTSWIRSGSLRCADSALLVPT